MNYDELFQLLAGLAAMMGFLLLGLALVSLAVEAHRYCRIVRRYRRKENRQ